MPFRNSSVPRSLCCFVTYCQISYVEATEKKQPVFLQSFNLPKFVILGSSLVTGLLSLLLCCQSGVNQYAGQKYSIWG